MDARKRVVVVAERLLERSEELVEVITQTCADSVAPQHRATITADVGAIAPLLVPEALLAIATGRPVPDEALAEIVSCGGRARSTAVPITVVMRCMQAAVARFARYTAELAEPVDAMAAVVVVGRASVLTHQFTAAYAHGYVRRVEPRWWRAMRPVARRTLELVAGGLTSREIAERLQYSEQAICYHVRQLMGRLGAPNRIAMVSRAWELQLITGADTAVRPDAAILPAGAPGQGGDVRPSSR